MRSTALFVLFACGLGAPAAAQERADLIGAPPGASACTGCHGTAGEPAMPLEALPAEAIAEALAAFAEGSREATVMGRIARGFTTEEMRAIAEWFGREE